MELQTYTPMGVAFLAALLFCGLFTVLAIFIGPKRVGSAMKAEPFECGSPPLGTPRARYSVKFYQVAILFLVFDIESAFMYPWAVLYRDTLSVGPVNPMTGVASVSFFGFGEMLVFVAVLVVALTYVWRKKAIGWD